MLIKARYEDGVFRPLEDVKGIRSGNVVNISFGKSLRNSAFFGMWASRKDIKSGRDYIKKIRQWKRS